MNLKIFVKSTFNQLLPSKYYFFNDFKLYVTSASTNNRMSTLEIEKSLRQINYLKRIEKAKALSHSSRVTLQIIGAGINGTPSCLYVVSDHMRYMFNCGEGTQRLAHEHGSKLSRLENIFFTSPTWKNMGGLPGMALTVQESGLPNLNLHGPKGIGHIYTSVKKFVYLTSLTINEAECGEDNVYQDSCMSIRYIHLTKASSASQPEPEPEIIYYDDTSYYEHEVNGRSKRHSTKYLPTLKKKVFKREPNQFYGSKVNNCIAYVCEVNPKAGRLNPNKCVEMGVTPGPLLGKLKNGEDVTLDNGTVVKSSEVTWPSSPRSIFIVLECPNEDYLDSLINHEKFKDFQIGGSQQDTEFDYIIHFSPENIMRNPRYIEWMKKFPPNIQHVVINNNNSGFTSDGIHKLQHKLNLLHPTIFPMLPEAIIDNEQSKEIEKNDEIFGDLNIHRAKVLNSINLRPGKNVQKGLDKTVIIPNRTENVNEVMQIDGFPEALAELQTEINAKSELIKNLPEFPKILMVGTGSSIPNKVRNTSGILLRIDEDTSILLDCGEGTAGQIIRFYGSKADKIFSSIKGVYISHLHADHHVGLIGFIQERQKLTSEPFFLIAPKIIEIYLRMYHKIFEPIEDSYILVTNEGIALNSLITLPLDAKNELYNKLKLKDITTVEALHCLYSFCVSLTLKNGEKIVYSGDTKPCFGLRILGRDCDLLIHEATMGDGLEKEADKKKHSTISQAINEGKAMEAKFILLTHFSQRYCKMPRLPETMDKANFNNVGISFDNMEFSFAEMSLLPLFYPSLNLIFSEFHNTLEERTQRSFRRENRIVNKLII